MGPNADLSVDLADDRTTATVALSAVRDADRDLLGSLLAEYDVVDLGDAVPDDADLCVVDETGLARHGEALAAWRERQRPTFAPVLLLAATDETNPWERYADALTDRVDAIQPIPAPRAAIRARVESLLESRRLSVDLANERRLVERIFDTSPVAKTVLDTDGNIVRVNERAEAVLGLSRSAVPGRRYDSPEWHIVDERGNPIPSDDLPFSRVMRTGDPVYGYEHGIEHPDGERVWLSVNVAPLRDESGEIQYLVSAIEDVTERKRLERSLRESEQLHRTTLSNIQDTVFLTDDAGRFTYVCPNVNYIFGYTTDEVREMGSVHALLGDDPAPGTFDEADVVENVERVVTDADGREHTVLVTVKSVATRGGTRLYSVRDVTELVASEHALALERERLDAVLANAPLVLLAVDSDGTITVANGRQLSALGFDRRAVLGADASGVFADLPEVRDAVERALDGESFVAEHRVGDRVLEVSYRARFTDGDVDHAVLVAQDVTERKRQEAQFRAFVEHSSDVVTVLADDGTVTYQSPAVERVLGYDPAELVGENAFDLVHPDDRERVAEAFQRGLERRVGTMLSEEYRFRHVDGSYRWLDSVGIADALPGGGHLVTSRDVTERVEAERELRRLNESRSLALTASQAGVWEWNLKTDEVQWHESCERLFGLDPGTFDGTYEAFADFVHPADLPAVEAVLERAVASGESFRVTYRITRADGEERWIDGRGTLLTDESGDPERLLGVDVDVTERKERERDLEQYEQIIETAADPIYALDPDGNVVLANQALATVTGRTKAELLDTNVTELLSSEDVAASLDHVRALAEGRADPGTLEVSVESPTGYRQFEVNVSLLDESTADGVPGSVGVARDVTAARERLQQLQIMDRVLRHNLRNHLNVVRGYAETIRDAAPAPYTEHADRILEYCDHLLTQAEKQREITRVLATEPTLEPVDVVAAVRFTAETLSTRYPDARVDLDLPTEASVWASSLLDRAIAELVTNAIEHTDREAPEVTVTVAVDGDAMQIRVADTGPGIPEVERHVVDGFHEDDPLAHGGGIGLWLVTWIVRRSNGSLDFEANDPRGTVVTLTLERVATDVEDVGEA